MTSVIMQTTHAIGMPDRQFYTLLQGQRLRQQTIILHRQGNTRAGLVSAAAVLTRTQLEHLREIGQGRRDHGSRMQRCAVRKIKYQGWNIACMQMWTMFVRDRKSV